MRSAHYRNGSGQAQPQRPPYGARRTGTALPSSPLASLLDHPPVPVLSLIALRPPSMWAPFRLTSSSSTTARRVRVASASLVHGILAVALRVLMSSAQTCTLATSSYRWVWAPGGARRVSSYGIASTRRSTTSLRLANISLYSLALSLSLYLCTDESKHAPREDEGTDTGGEGEKIANWSTLLEISRGTRLRGPHARTLICFVSSTRDRHV